MHPDKFAFLQHTGAAGLEVASVDWVNHPLGPLSGWPDELRIALALMLGSAFPSALAWGDELYTFYNDAYLPILGDRPIRGQGLRLKDMWQETWPTLQPLVQKVLQGAPVSFENAPFDIRRSGASQTTYFTFSYSPVPGPGGSPHGVLSTLVETTETVTAHARLKASEERLQMALDASDDVGMWANDPSSGVVVGDARFARMFGLGVEVAQEGVCTVALNQKVHPDDRLKVTTSVERALSDGLIYEDELRLPQDDGSIRWIYARGRRISDGGAVPRTLFAGTVRDVTARKRLELESAEANARKDEFLAMLAHELRNPLAPIRAAADLISMCRPADPRLERAAAIVSRQVTHLSGLVDDLLDVSRVTRGLVTLETAHVDLRTVVLAAVEQVRPLFEQKGHRLTLELSSEGIVVAGDQKRLIQVVGNLLTNAARYTPASGAIVVELHMHDGEASLTVSDDGIGMSAQLVPRVFELFAQGERSPDRDQGGLGIGLALVRSLVDAHGGTVRASSAGPGQGSQFQVRLPVLAQLPVSDGEDGAGERVWRHACRRVLIVDDNKDAAATLSMVLEELGHQCFVEHDGRGALARARREQPDVLLLDIGLPDMDGFELARVLREEPVTSRSLIVAVTGYGQDADRSASAAAGFDHHMVKPLDTSRLAEVLASWADIGDGSQQAGPVPG